MIHCNPIWGVNNKSGYMTSLIPVRISFMMKLSFRPRYDTPKSRQTELQPLSLHRRLEHTTVCACLDLGRARRRIPTTTNIGKAPINCPYQLYDPAVEPATQKRVKPYYKCSAAFNPAAYHLFASDGQKLSPTVSLCPFHIWGTTAGFVQNNYW